MFHPNQKYIIVNFHYVHDFRPDWSGMRPCPVAEFERQINFLSAAWKIVSVREVFEAAEKFSPDRYCALTFDDGLKDHLDNVVPFLKREKLKGTFFPITCTWEERLPPAHRIQVLLSKFERGKLIDIFHGFMKEFYPDLAPQYFIPRDRRLAERHLHDDILTANFKETILALPDDVKGRFLRFCFKNLHLDEKKIVRELFMTRAEVQKLAQEGFWIGNHSHNHYALDTMSQAALRKDIELAKKLLEKLAGYKIGVFSYPHGRSTPLIMEILKSASIYYGVTIENRELNAADNPLLLPRYDTNKIKDYLDQTSSHS